MQAHEPAIGWTVVLRRRPVRIVAGRPEGGYTDTFELICCNCGDHPGLDHREVSAELQRIRGPYLFAAGIAAYEEHVEQYHRIADDSASSRPPYTTSTPTGRTAPASFQMEGQQTVSARCSGQRERAVAMSSTSEQASCEDRDPGRAFTVTRRP
jgi:hypothetical protein